MGYHRYRRTYGLLLGALTGLAYTLVAQHINAARMPGIPFYQPPLGPVGNTLIGLGVGALLGVITAWAETGAKGVLAASLAGSALLVGAGLVTGQSDPTAWTDKLIALAIIFVPSAAILAPALIFFRWLVNREEEAYRESATWRPPPLLPRLMLPALLVLGAASAGLTSQYNDLGRAVTPRMHDLIQMGRSAPSSADLPAPLQAVSVQFFYENRTHSYTLQWDKDDNNKFAIPRPNTSPFDQSTVIARFENGYLLACVYPDPNYEPRCKDFPPRDEAAPFLP
jgi:hypothetical protein